MTICELPSRPTTQPPATILEHDFRNFIKDRGFPCVGAKSALGRGALKKYIARDVTSAWDDLAIHAALATWVNEIEIGKGKFHSFAILFEGPTHLDEAAFERALWDRLQSLSDKDAWRGFPYDETVSHDPDSPHFSLSFGGQAFFAVGLHPSASRPARRFATPAIVLNPHAQFEQLRAEGRYETLRASILDRDLALAGTMNPMLDRHGASSAARQFSGRAVGPEWLCPFSDPRA